MPLRVMVVADPDEALIEAIAEAIFVDQPCVKPWKYEQCWVHEHSGFDDPSPSPRCDYVLSRARAVVAVADEEHAALVAEVERLRGEVARMRLERDCSDAALVVLKGDADSLGDALTEEVLRAEAAEAKVAKGEALADEEEAKCLLKPPLLNGSRFPAIVSVAALRAVLADAPAGEVTPSAGEVHNRLASNCRERPGLPFGNQTCYVCAGGVTPPANAPAEQEDPCARAGRHVCGPPAEQRAEGGA